MIRAIIFSCIALGIALIAMLFYASSNNAVFEQHYASLFWLGLALTIGLLILIVVQVVGLVKKLRGRVFGSTLALRLMAVFALMAVIPGGLVYVISVQFLNRSVDSWFDVPVDRAFESALNLGRAALEASGNELLRRSRDAALKAADSKSDATGIARQLRQQYGFDEVVIVDEDAKIKGWQGGGDPTQTNRTRLMPDKPTVAEVKDAISKGPQKFTETLGDRVIFFRVVILMPAAPSIEGTRTIQLMQSAPRILMKDAQTVDAGARDYQRLQLLREGLNRVFGLTLTLAMVLTLFSAISLSFLLSERLSAPLSALAESTRAIAKGDFTKLNPVKSRDEFGVLTQSFNTMTRQLSEASEVVARKQHQLVTANAYLESILGNLTSGVVTLDAHLKPKSVNRIAANMLEVEPEKLHGLSLADWGTKYSSLVEMVAEIVQQLTMGRDKPWEKQFIIINGANGPVGAVQNSLPNVPPNTGQTAAIRNRTLLVRGTKLPQSTNADYILVFDDITGLIQAQRDAAWGEVARRLAHEIKNPLTPIQLSAERLQMKLAEKLPDLERDLLNRATSTIVAQVNALKGMVDDFSLYSRASRLKPCPVDLNELVADVLTLYETMAANMKLNLGSNLPMISADPSLLRQVIHNLMQNAQDAFATSETDEKPVVTITTGRDDGNLLLTVADNGCGISDEVVARMFEPYVTTKTKGTGLGLAIVKKIIDEHHGTISVKNILPHGAEITIALPIEPIRDSAIELAETS